MKLIHVSDLHIGGGAAQLDGSSRLVQHLLDNPIEKASIILSGDIVDGRSTSEWAIARKVLERLSVRYDILAVPGNHDVSEARGLSYDETAAKKTRDCLDRLCPSFKRTPSGLRVAALPGLKIIGLDSNVGNSDDLFAPLARGEVGRVQLLALEMELMDDMPIIIVLHHKPYCNDIFHLLEDRDQLIKLIERRPNVKAVMFGHLHHWSLVDRGGTRWMESDNTSISHRYRILDTTDWSITSHSF